MEELMEMLCTVCLHPQKLAVRVATFQANQEFDAAS